MNLDILLLHRGPGLVRWSHVQGREGGQRTKSDWITKKINGNDVHRRPRVCEDDDEMELWRRVFVLGCRRQSACCPTMLIQLLSHLPRGGTPRAKGTQLTEFPFGCYEALTICGLVPCPVVINLIKPHFVSVCELPKTIFYKSGNDSQYVGKTTLTQR